MRLPCLRTVLTGCVRSRQAGGRRQAQPLQLSAHETPPRNRSCSSSAQSGCLRVVLSTRRSPSSAAAPLFLSSCASRASSLMSAEPRTRPDSERSPRRHAAWVRREMLQVTHRFKGCISTARSAHPRLIEIRIDQHRHCNDWTHGRGTIVIDSIGPQQPIESGRFRYFPGTPRHVR